MGDSRSGSTARARQNPVYLFASSAMCVGHLIFDGRRSGAMMCINKIAFQVRAGKIFNRIYVKGESLGKMFFSAAARQ